GAGLRPQGVPEQALALAELRRRRGAATQAHARLLRLLRLALVGARPLDAGAHRAHFSRSEVHAAHPRGAGPEPDRGKRRRRSRLSARRRTRQLRASVWAGVAAAARVGVARVGRPAGERALGQSGAARAGRDRAAESVAAEAFASGAL